MDLLVKFNIHKFNSANWLTIYFKNKLFMYYSYLVYLFRKGDNLGIKRKEVSFITDKLSIDKLYKILVFKRLTVINISGSNHEAEYFSTLIAYQTQLKSDESDHGTFASLCYFFECLVDMDSLILAYTGYCQRSGCL